MTHYKKILIANRGEIACRVIRTARNLGYRTVAVYSDADQHAPHVSQADESINIGPSPAAESYLVIAKIIAAAKQTGADAIHPGYGFLSERAEFAQACVDNHIVFIGPPASAINAMGDKAAAKRRMIEAGVPTVPGYLGEDQSDDSLIKAAEQVGYPLLVKAVAGGGGRGMRRVTSADLLKEAIDSARREATSAFGDGTLMLERLIEHGRHIEIQVFADNHGNAVHLGERDCTAQRRRQKVIEEAPSPIVGPEMRAAMGKDAVAAALAVGYRGAGTIEFIVDQDMKHYFLEMNTRLQVEHPVTECITGLDLVEWQLRVAAGDVLPLQQAHIDQRIAHGGHAIEARLYAEDPYSGFTPQTGPIIYWRPDSAKHAGVRVDDGIREGNAVSPFYDAMVAKVIAHGRDRNDAIRRLIAALEDSPLLGLANNGTFLRDLIDHPEFREAKLHTTRLDEWLDNSDAILQAPQPTAQDWAIVATLLADPNKHGAALSIKLSCGAAQERILVQPHGHDHAISQVGAGNTAIDVQILGHDGPHLRYRLDGVTGKAIAVRVGDEVHLARGKHRFVFREASPFPTTDNGHDPRRAKAPVAGTVVQVKVAAGDTVVEGQQLVCVEAMKMEMWLTASAAGSVTAVHVARGEQVAAGALLVELELAA
ncbi:MAG: ATP-grasp domain-containing protein [Rhodocyclaceae bacterium]|nr:ATP-grasp domain-containing protein [Rhodocyclaceae bacterium]